MQEVKFRLLNKKGEILIKVSRPWFINGIVSNNVRVSGELLRNSVPETSKFVKSSINIFIEAFERVYHLWCCVVLNKECFEAVLNKGISVLIFSHMVALNRFTVSSEPHQGSWNVMRTLGNEIIGIEVWHAFTTSFSRKEILMSIYHSIDSFFSQSIDEFVNLIKVCHIIEGR